MPNKTVYIRPEDEEAWNNVSNKSKWVHDGLTSGLVTIPATSINMATSAAIDPEKKERELTETPKTAVDRVIAQTEDYFDKNPKKAQELGFCKHNAVKGFCKKGCK